MNSTNQNQFIEFLFKCLDKHERKASILFTKLDLENGRVDIISRLLNDYSETFDFEMINPKFLMKTFSELLIDLNKLKIESTNQISEMKSEIQKQQSLLSSFQQSSNELKSSYEEQFKKLQQEMSDQIKIQNEHKIEYENMKNKMIEMEAYIKEKLSRVLVSNIIINAEKDFIFINKTITLTALVIPDNASNKGVAWKIIQQDEGTIETVDKDARSLTLKALKKGKKVKISAIAIDGSEIRAEKEMPIVYFNCEFNVKVQSNQTIKGTIQITEVGLTLDKEKSRYFIDSNSSKVVGEKAYSSSLKFENLTQNVSFMKGKGTYYLHALIVDTDGNSEEFVSDALTTNGASPLTFEYNGRVQSVELESGEYKLEVWGAQGATAYYKSLDYIRTGGKGGYSVGTINLQSKTKLFVYVGGKGVPKKSNQKVEGGFNGGGYNADTRDDYEKGVGGGGTDIRVNVDSLYSRVIVAGGGGGGNGATSGGGSTGGAGGGLNGCVGIRQSNSNDEYQKTNATAGTQISGGRPGIGCGSFKFDSSGEVTATGVFGIGGSVPSEPNNTMAGAGGGGWYGGGAGNGHGGGGAGGSGWVFTEYNYNQWKSGNSADANQFILDSSFYLKNAQTISGDKEFVNTSGTGKETGHCGDGYAKITPI